MVKTLSLPPEMSTLGSGNQEGLTGKRDALTRFTEPFPDPIILCPLSKVCAAYGKRSGGAAIDLQRVGDIDFIIFELRMPSARLDGWHDR
jgi:hypothetical protein